MKRIFYTLIALLCASSPLLSQDKTVGLKFDGSDDYVLIPHSADLNLGRSPFTIEAWIQADTNNNSTLAPVILSKKGASSPSTDGMLFGLDNNGRLALQLEGQSFNPTGGGGGGGPGVSAIDLRDNVCHHIAWTREVGGVEDTVNGYQDAALVRKTRLRAYTLDVSNNEDMWIGWSDFNTTPNTYQFSGIIKEIRIWDFAKTEAQIFADRNKHIVGNETGLIAYWRLNENFGDTAYDCSAGENHGTLQGGALFSTTCDVLDALPSSCVPDTSGGPIDTTGIETNTLKTSLDVFPNPTTNSITLAFGKEVKDWSLVLTNIQGQQINQWRFNNTAREEINIEAPAGMYLLHVRTSIGNKVIRVFRE